MENQYLRLKGDPSGCLSYVTSPWYTTPVTKARVITQWCPGRTVQSCVLAVLWMPCTAGRAEAVSELHNCGSAPAQPFVWICSRCPSRCSQRQEAFPPIPGTSYARPGEQGLSLPGTAGLMVRLHYIRGLIQPTQLYDSFNERPAGG